MKKNDYNNETEKITEFPQDQTSVEPNINPTGNTQQNPLQIPDSSYFKLFTEQTQNLSSELQQQLSEKSSWKQILDEIER